MTERPMDREQTTQKTSSPAASKADVLEQRLRMANAISGISARLSRICDLDSQFDDSLAEVGASVGADRAYVFQFRESGALMDNTHEWCAEGVTPQITELQGLPSEALGWFVEKVRQDEAFQISDVSALPAEAESERSILEAQGIRSLLIMPMGADGHPAGFVGFDNVREVGEWRPEDIDLLRVVSQLMGDALDRRRSHQALEFSLQRQMAILENIPDIAWLKDADSRFIHVNDPFARSCGVAAEEVIGKTDLDIWPRELATRYRQDDVEVMRTRRRKQVEEPLADKDIGERLIETIKTPVFDSNGRVIGTTGIARDVTERKQAELAIRESEEQYRRLVESLPAIVYRYSARNGASYWSPQIEKILGYSQRDLREKPFLWHDAIHPDDLPTVDQAIAAFEVGNRIDLNYRIRDAYGNWHWFHDRSIGRLDVEGEAVVDGLAFDISPQKRAEQALRESEEKYRLLVEHQTDMVVKVDLEGRFLFVSRSYCEAFGKTEDELLGNASMPLVHEEDREATAKAMEALYHPPHECYLEQRALTKDGWRWLAWADRAVLDASGEVVAIVGVGRDISERKLTQEALAHERERALITLHSIGDAVITTDAEGRVEYLNPVAESLTGWTNAEAADRPLAEIFRIIDEDTREPAEDPVSRCLNEGHIIGLANHTALISRSGEERAIEDSAAPIRDARGQVFGVVLVFKDITERRRLDQKLAYAATHDSLTGLINRAEFEERLDHALAAFLTHGTPSVLCYLDLDQFKVVNDAAGHTAGDEMLKQVAALLSANVRSRDTLARLGGDEFGLLLENCPVGNAMKIAEALIGTLADFRFTWGRRRFGVGVSIGLAPFAVEGAERSVLTSHADMACFAAKDMGRNRVYVYHPEDSELMHRHREIIRTTELREALEQEQFVLYAQPIASASAPFGEPWRYEVLVRLRGQDDELLLPGAFIPAAERYGLIGELDRWVIKTALREYAGLDHRRARVGIAINISGTSLSDESLPDFVRSELTASGVSPSRICFEITETAAINRLSMAKRFIEDLRELGCSFALDDFGSGLSSFNYLKQLPVDCLKVDGSFVKDMPKDPVDEAMVKAINEIGHVMGIKTVAEHVDNQAVLSAAVASGVDFLQGFEIGKPVPLREIQTPKD